MGLRGAVGQGWNHADEVEFEPVYQPLRLNANARRAHDQGHSHNACGDVDGRNREGAAVDRACC